MITIKFLGGVKKSFNSDEIKLNNDSLTIQELFDYLIKTKPSNTPDLDFNNLIVAVNGVDSSIMNGKLTKLNTGDVISLIPIIHGGSHTRFQFTISNTPIELFEIKLRQKFGVEFLDDLRKKFPYLIIQGVSSEYILNKHHTKKIINISLLAKKNNILLSKKLETDIIMRFAATTQISQAINKVGIKKGKNFFIIAIGKKVFLNKLYIHLKQFLSKKPYSKNNQKFLKKKFKISKKQLDIVVSKNPLEDLLTEKAAILA